MHNIAESKKCPVSEIAVNMHISKNFHGRIFDRIQKPSLICNLRAGPWQPAKFQPDPQAGSPEIWRQKKFYTSFFII